VVAAKHGAVPPEVLLGLEAAAEDDVASRRSVHDGEPEHDHDDFDSFWVPLPPIADVAALIERLTALARAHDILRLKGFAAVAGKASRLVVQGVGERFTTYFDRPWKDGEKQQGHLVVIGLKGLDRTAIEAAIASS
jgi:cobalamin biosynthesis protein CobW